MDQALDKCTFHMLRDIAWCLSNFKKGEISQPFELIARAVPALVRAMQRTDIDAAGVDIVWGLYYFTQQASSESLICLVNTVGSVPKLIELTQHQNLKIAIPAIRTVGNIVSSDESHLFQSAIEAGTLQVFREMVDHSKAVIRKEVCLCIQ